jgi:multiple sugar transport system substrate-binding protein
VSARVRLKGITWDHPRGYAGLLAATRAYARLRPDVDVRWDRLPLAAAFESRPVSELAAGYDLLVLDHPFAGDAAAQECLVELTPHGPWLGLADLAGDTVGPSFASYRYGGGLWALPLDASCQVAVWRPDRLADGPPPATLDAAFRLGRGRGLAMALHGVHALMTLFTLCANLGAPPGGEGDAPGALPPLLPRPAGGAALEALRELAGRCVPEARMWSPIAALEALSQRDDLVYASYVFAYATYCRSHAEGVRRLRFGRIPGVVGTSGAGAVLGGTGLAISRRCPHLSPALAFAGFLTGAAAQAAMALPGGTARPPLRLAGRRGRRRQRGLLRGHPGHDRAGVPAPPPPGDGALPGSCGGALGDWLDGGRPASEALETINRLYERHVARPT